MLLKSLALTLAFALGPAIPAAATSVRCTTTTDSVYPNETVLTR